MGGLAVAGFIAAMPRMSRVVAVIAATLAISVGLAGPFAYSVATAATGKSGSIPSAGPAVAGGAAASAAAVAVGPAAAPAPASAVGGGGTGGSLAADAGGTGAPAAPARLLGGHWRHSAGGAGGGLGGLLDASTPSAALEGRTARRTPSKYTWVAATVGSNNAAGLQLATRRP